MDNSNTKNGSFFMTFYLTMNDNLAVKLELLLGTIQNINLIKEHKHSNDT